MSQRIPKMIAIGKVARDGKILRATPGVSIELVTSPRHIFGLGPHIAYDVLLPERLVCDTNYIIQLTAENYGENGPDYVITSIACRNQKTSGFQVIIWGDRLQTVRPNEYSLKTVQSNWHFVIYDML